jgi:hypothetical protein
VRLGSINLRVEWKTECKVRRKDKRRNASCDNVARVRGRKMRISNIVDSLLRRYRSVCHRNGQETAGKQDEALPEGVEERIPSILSKQVIYRTRVIFKRLLTLE